MGRGRVRMDSLYLGSKGEKGIEDIATVSSLSGAVNGSRGHQNRRRFGRMVHKFNFEHTVKVLTGHPGETRWAFGDTRLRCR